ncbi:MAG: hypothetical protein HC838_04075 [Spirulinaceae cyanobacterium RM2_2_10]|nr:hypothetical protein [Spirulinaceae cyanobacterium RM2_2_10]
MKTIQKLLIGTSAALSASLIATAPAFAVSLMTNIQFGTDDYRAYSIDSYSDGNIADAISALTDTSALTNVELGVSSEDQVGNIGFTADLAGHAVKVETVTAADWAGGLAQQWFADFSAAYPSLVAASIPGVGNLGNAILAAVSSGATRSGDPNVVPSLRTKTTTSSRCTWSVTLMSSMPPGWLTIRWYR